MSYIATTKTKREYTDSTNASGLGVGTKFFVTIFCDCFPGDDECDDPYPPYAEVKEIYFARIMSKDGNYFWSSLGCNALSVDAIDWNKANDFVQSAIKKEWKTLEPVVLAADAVSFETFGEEEGYEF